MAFLSGHILPRLFSILLGTAFVLGAGQASAQQDLLEKLFRRNKDKDSTEVRPKKPLESYFFDDSVRKRSLFAWRADMFRNDIHPAEIDTMPNRFEVDYPFLRNDVGAAYLGNLGAAAQPLNYFIRPELQNFSFLTAYDSYIITPARARFYNVKRPFTHLSYFMSGQTRNAEEQLRITHAQNISPSTGFNIEYFNRGTRGIYSSQRSKDKNFSFAFSHTGKKYSIHAGYIYNMAEVRENGGVQRDEDITDTIFNPPSNIAVQLKDAQNRFKGNTFYLVQAYGIPLQRVTDEDFSIADKSSIFVGHAFEYTRYFKNYSDTREKTNEGFYEHWYIDPDRSLDSINESIVDNRLFLQIQPWNRNGIIGTIDAGIGYSFNHYYNFSLGQYLNADLKGNRKNDAYVYGSLEGKLKKYVSWNAGINYHPFGFRSQDMRLDAQLKISAYIKSRPITLTVSGFIDNRSPNYWDEHYFSNHFVWNNDFAKETETRIDGKLEIPSIGLEAGVWQSLVKDKIYYDASGVPAQFDGNLSVSGVYLRKDFKAGIFRFNHRALLQWSSHEEVAPVPLLSAYAAYFIDFFVVRNVLRVQLGLDGWYNTKYYAPGYNPAVMQFYNQREKKLGAYPWLDAFVSAKWKRMRILVKLQHMNEDLFGERNYFSVLHYPLNKRMFKLGFSWGFYD